MSSYEATTPRPDFIDMARNPQPTYRTMRDTAAVVPVNDRMVIVCRRGGVQGGFRRPEGFLFTQSGRDGGGVPQPRGLLVQHVGGRSPERAADDPAADRSPRPQEVPQDPRP